MNNKEVYPSLLSPAHLADYSRYSPHQIVARIQTDVYPSNLAPFYLKLSMYDLPPMNVYPRALTGSYIKKLNAA